MKRVCLCSWIASLAVVPQFALAQIDLVSAARAPMTGFTGITPQSVSADGRYVAFFSTCPDLVTGVGNGFEQVYRWDTLTDQVLLISRKTNGTAASGTSDTVSISDDGSKIAFISADTSLASGGAGSRSVYYATISGSTVTLRTVATDTATLDPYDCNISGDGQFIVYGEFLSTTSNERILRYSTSTFTSAVIVDSNAQHGGQFVGDPVCNANGSVVAYRVNFNKVFTTASPFTGSLDQSEITAGVFANNTQFSPRLSGDGIWLTYASAATNIVGGANGQRQVFSQQVNAFGSFIDSLSTGGAQANGGCFEPQLSTGAGFTSFRTAASNFATTSVAQIYRRDNILAQLALMSVQVDDVTPLAAGASSFSTNANATHFAYVAPYSAHYPGGNTNNGLFLRNSVTGETFQLRRQVKTIGDFSTDSISLSRDGSKVHFLSESRYHSKSIAPAFSGYQNYNYLWTAANPNEPTMLLKSRENSAGYFPELSISADGNWAVLATDKPLDAADTNGQVDTYRINLSTLGRTLVSRKQDGTLGNGQSGGGSISESGNLVAFQSRATNLGLTPAPGDDLVWIKDMTTGQLTCASIHAPGNGYAFQPKMSANGETVVFRAENSLAAGGVPGSSLVQVGFYRKTGSGVTTGLVSGVNGVPANGSSFLDGAAVDDSGRYVVFASSANNLIPGVSDRQVYRKDLLSGEIEHVSVTELGVAQNDDNFGVSISPDGQFVAFGSYATNLDPGATTFLSRTFVKDMATGKLTLESRSDTNAVVEGIAQGISDRGTFVLFSSGDTVLTAFPKNGRLQAYRRKLKNVANLVKGRVILDRYGADYNQRLTIEALTSSDGLIETYSVITDEDGDYQFVTTHNSQLKLRIKGKKWLSRVTSLVNPVSTVYNMPTMEMPGGDCDNNNVVTTDDYLILSLSFDTSEGDAGYDDRADLDGNKSITTDDYLILSDRFDQEGE